MYQSFGCVHVVHQFIAVSIWDLSIYFPWTVNFRQCSGTDHTSGLQFVHQCEYALQEGKLAHQTLLFLYILSASPLCVEYHVIALWLCASKVVTVIVTCKGVTVSSLQLSAVILLPKLLQMVYEMALVEPLHPQWPTPVTQGTPCKETTHVLAWPTKVGVGEHLLAVVSCSQLDALYTLDIHGHQ